MAATSDSTMLRIGSMNMLMHGIEGAGYPLPRLLSEGASEDAEKYTLILANPPFAGSLDAESTAKDLQRVVRFKKTELLFWHCSSSCCSSLAGGRRSSSPRGAVRIVHGPQGNYGASSSRTRSSTAS